MNPEPAEHDESEKLLAKDKGPFFLLGGFYLALVTVGFHAVAPPLAPTALLIVALELVVFAHLLNVYQVALLLPSYPKVPFALDLVSVCVIAWMFKLLVFPVLGGLNGFLWPRWDRADLYQRIVLEKVFAPNQVGDELRLQAYRTALSRFFMLGLALWVLYICWHTFTVRELVKKRIVLNRPWVYAVGWTAWLVLDLIGLWATVERPEWNSMINIVAIVSALGTLVGALFLIAVVALEAIYRKRKEHVATTKAYVFITATAGQSADVAQKVGQTPGVQHADVCLGEPSIIAVVEASSSKDLYEMVDKTIGRTPNVTATDTHLVSET